MRIVHDVCREAAATPFDWGEEDCLFGLAARVAERITGSDAVARLRGRYDSRMSALRLMAEEGWRDMGDCAAAFFEEIHPSRAAAGDWVHLVNADGTDAIGVCAGETCVAKGETGIARVPRSRAVRAFRVA